MTDWVELARLIKIHKEYKLTGKIMSYKDYLKMVESLLDFYDSHNKKK